MIIKPTGPNPAKKPSNLPNVENMPPIMPVSFPNICNTGPTATASNAKPPATLCTGAGNCANHLTAPLTTLIIMLNAVPIFSPNRNAPFCTASLDNHSKNSPNVFLDFSKAPLKSFSPI